MKTIEIVREEKQEIVKQQAQNFCIKEEQQSKNKKRDKMWDIVKGIGIMSIVLGHVAPTIATHNFVYIYHLIIFYFVAAFFYNEKKYGDKPLNNMAQRIKSNLPKYFLYSSILVLLHNFFVQYNFYNPWVMRTRGTGETISTVINNVTLWSDEFFAGALWFIPTLIFAITVFGFVVFVARKISSFFISKTEQQQNYIKYALIIIATGLIGIVGAYLNIIGWEVKYNLHTSLLVMPICTLGYFARQYYDKIKIIKKWYIAIPMFIITTCLIAYMAKIPGMQIELSKEIIISGYMFYIVAVVGICFVLSFASILERIPLINKIFEVCGKHSFAVMALHFACIKAVDVVYCYIIGETDANIISTWVCAFPEKLWPVYFIVGLGIPVIISIIVEFIKNRAKKSVQYLEDRKNTKTNITQVIEK